MRHLIKIVLLSLILALTACQLAAPPSKFKSVRDWGSYYPDCKAGGWQAPIDIPNQVWRDDEAVQLKLNLVDAVAELKNDGRMFQLIYSNSESTLHVGNSTYYLKSISIHVPGETYITSQKYPMEWQLLFEDRDGDLVIVAVLVRYGSANPMLGQLRSSLPKSYQHRKIFAEVFKLSSFSHQNLNYYSFEGSLTSPPCTPNVRWYVLKTTMTATPEEINAFRIHSRHGTRPLQALNGRKVITDA